MRGEVVFLYFDGAVSLESRYIISTCKLPRVKVPKYPAESFVQTSTGNISDDTYRIMYFMWELVQYFNAESASN